MKRPEICCWRTSPKQTILSYYVSSRHLAHDPCATYVIAIGINTCMCPYIYLLNTLNIYCCLLQKDNQIFRLLYPCRERGLGKQLPFLFQAPLENHTYGLCISSHFHRKHNIHAAQRMLSTDS